MRLTTKDVIKILPIEEDVRVYLLESVDGSDPDRKYLAEKLVWEAYDTLYELKLEENMQLAMVGTKQGQERLDKDFYKRVREQTEKEMQEEAIQNTEKVDLSEARKAMEKIVREIQASKNVKR